MSVGDSAQVGLFSYLAVGVESTFKTYSTCTAALQFLSASMKTSQETKVLEHISTDRTYADRIALSKMVEGEIEFYAAADNDACQRIIQNAMGGGTITTATATGDTTGAGVLMHTYDIKNFSSTYTSLCLNHRKGSSQIFQYSGVRVGEITFSGEVDEALKCSVSLVGVDSTSSGTDLSSLFPNVTQTPLSFSNMRLSIEGSFASLTSSAFWHVQSFEFGINNNLKSDNDSRRIGSSLLDVIPPGVAQFTFNFSMRFDTLTAYSAMLNETNLAAQLSFQGATYSGSTIRREMQINMPSIYIMDAGDPEIGGPDEILKSEVSCVVMRDKTSGGYAVQMKTFNKTTSY